MLFSFKYLVTAEFCFQPDIMIIICILFSVCHQLRILQEKHEIETNFKNKK